MKHKSTFFLSIISATGTLITTQPTACATESDDRIEAAAKNSYVFKTFLKDDSVMTESKDGVVTLTGSVSETFHKAMAQDTVESLPAVKSVNNRITVTAENPTENSDKWMAQRVKAALLFHRTLDSSRIEVSADRGYITLQGAASSQAQKELTTEYAKDVEGVKDVKNEMTVAESKTASGRTLTEKIDDASITAQIKASLLVHRSTSVLNTHIETREGAVTVSGIAANASEKSLVTKLITAVEGVNGVSNNMTLR